MARAAVTLALVALLALAFTDSAAATLGKGKLFSKGKGISFTTQCQDVCRDSCRLTPKKTCEDVAVPYQECSKVPVTSTRKSCSKKCTTVTETPAPVPAPAPASGKGKAVTLSLGKGRHLLKKGLPLLMAPKGKTTCEDVCQDVPVTTYETKCESKTRTAQSCKISLEQTCEKKCRPMCTKVPVVVETPKVEAQPIMLTKGKGL